MTKKKQVEENVKNDECVSQPAEYASDPTRRAKRGTKSNRYAITGREIEIVQLGSPESTTAWVEENVEGGVAGFNPQNKSAMADGRECVILHGAMLQKKAKISL